MIVRIRRRGVSLTEALIAVFIMALGLLALLSLFPVGAVQMAEAFKNERATQLANNADNMIRIWWRQAWTDPVTGEVLPDLPVPATVVPARENEPALRALDNPFAYAWPLYTVVTAGVPAPIKVEVPTPTTPTNYSLYDVSRDASTPSWPVFIDPIGDRTQPPGTQQWWVGDQDPNTGIRPLQPAINLTGPPHLYVPGIPRRSIQFPFARLPLPPVTGPPPYLPAPMTAGQAMRLCSLTDDITFSKGGDSLSAGGAAGIVERAARYNCSWLVQRFRNNGRTEANVHIVVYQGRPAADQAWKETVYLIERPSTAVNADTVVAPGANELTIITNGVRPALHHGNWVLISGLSTRPAVAPGTPPPVPIAEFYRVTAMTDVSPNNQPNSRFALELASPVRAVVSPPTVTSTTPGGANPFTYAARLIVLQGVVEVFDRGTITATAPPAS